VALAVTALPGRRQYTVIGDTVNVGARLCGQAGPGQVVLSESVRSAVDPAPTVEPLAVRPMKGVSAEFVAWKLVLDRVPSGTVDR
jgi:adenylate cyclase